MTWNAIKIAEQSKVLQEANCPIDRAFIAQIIQSLDPKIRNFRLVAGNVEALLLAHQKHLIEQQMIEHQKAVAAKPIVKNQKPASLPKTVARK